MTYTDPLPDYGDVLDDDQNPTGETVRVFRSKSEAVSAGHQGKFAIPSENDDGNWTAKGIDFIPTGTSGRAPSIQVVKSPRLTNADQYVNSYTSAFESVTGKAPGAIPLIVGAILAFLASHFLALLVAAIVIIIAAMIITSAYSTSTELIGNDANGNPVYSICSGTLLGRTCVAYNPTTGATDDLFSNMDIGGILITVVAVGAAAYIGFKIILPALTKKSGDTK